MSHDADETSVDLWEAAPIAMVIGGLGAMAYGGWGCARSWRLRHEGVSVAGRVIEIESDNDNGRWPIVEFDAQGKTHKFRSSCSIGPFYKLEVGASVPVRYSDGDATRAVIDSPYAAFRGPLSFLLNGLLCALFAYFWLLP